MAYLYKRHQKYWLGIYRGKGVTALRRPIPRPIGADDGDYERHARGVVATINKQPGGGGPAATADFLTTLAAELRPLEISLESLKDDFLAVKAVSVRATTLQWYTLYIGGFVEAFKDRAWHALTRGQVSRWIATRRRARPNHVRALKAFGRYCDAEGLWKDNVLTRLEGGSTRKREERLSDAEVARIEGALSDKTVRHLLGPFLAGAYAGLRASEICFARLENLDREKRTLWIGPVEVSELDPETNRSRTLRWTTKNGRPKLLPLHPKLWRTLRSGGEGWLFVRTDGRRWTRGALYVAMRRAAGCDLHILRHTFVSRLMDTGVGSSLARDLAGHSSIAVTDGYAHTDTDALRKAIGRL